MSLKDEIGIFIGNDTKLVTFAKVLVLLSMLAATLTAITWSKVGTWFTAGSGGIVASGILVRVILVRVTLFFLAFAAITLPVLLTVSWWVTVRLHKIWHRDDLVPKNMIPMVTITGLAVLWPAVIVFLLFTIA